MVTTSATHVLAEAELSRHQIIALDDLVDHSAGLVIEIRCRLDFGANAIDWRGLYKNPGA